MLIYQGREIRQELLASGDLTNTARTRFRKIPSEREICEGFCSRHVPGIVALHGEDCSVVIEAVSERKNEIRETIGHYGAENVFNVDETGLMFRNLPQRLYVVGSTGQQRARAAKGLKAKDNI